MVSIAQRADVGIGPYNRLITVDTVLFVCYHHFDNLITASWQFGRIAQIAEQDKRVKIPCGTAAVSTEKARHW